MIKITLKKLAFLLTTLLMSTMLMAQTATAPSVGDGSSGSPYEIATLNNLYWMSQNSGEWAKYFKQIGPIDAASTSGWDSNAGFTPIGNSTTDFTGNYDGQEYAIDGLFINRSDMFQGLFGFVSSSASIHNVTLTNANVSGSGYTGALLGGAMFGTVSVDNCSSSGSVSGIGDTGNFGGIVGYFSGSPVMINCQSSCSVSGNNAVGGLVGLNDGSATIKKCQSSGSVTGTGTDKRAIGGLAGGNNASIETSFSTSNVIGNENTGGLVGDNSSNIYNSYCKGDVSRNSGTNTSFGAFVGNANGCNIMYCYTTGKVLNTGASDQGFVGTETGSPTYTSNFFDSETSNQTTATGATAKTTEQMKTLSTFNSTWDFIGSGGANDYWNMDGVTNNAYAFLAWQTSGWTAAAKSSDWFTASNWNSGNVPTDSDDVTIANTSTMPSISGSTTANCNHLVVATASTLTINNDGGITIDGDLSNNGTINMQSDASATASLINYGSITNNGTINAQRYITNDEWHLISVPISDATVSTFANDYVQYYDGSWNDITVSTTPLSPVKGYSLWSVSKATTYTFTGNLNTGDQSISIYSANDGWNLIGNPYPSPIDWSILDDTYGAVYYWDPGTSNYVSWNAGVGSGSPDVPAMQGFWIKTTSNSTFSLDNDKRTHNGNTTYYKDQKELSNHIELEANGNNFQDHLFINFDNEATALFDFNFDAYKLLSPYDAVPQLYSLANNELLSIDRRPECELIQLGFRCGQNGTYSIHLNKLTDIASATLEDSKTGVMHNLQTGSYPFEYSITDDENRFKLHLNITGTNELEEDLFSVYADHKTIYIKSNQNINGTIKVYDIMGNVVFAKETNNSKLVKLETLLNTGVYIVSIENDLGLSAEKVSIK